MQCKLSVACSYCLVYLFSYYSNKNEQQKCGERAGVYTGIIMLGEKREVVMLLFLFYRNVGEEGEENGISIKKRYMAISDFFVVIGACFAPLFAGREYFLLFLQFH